MLGRWRRRALGATACIGLLSACGIGFPDFLAAPDGGIKDGGVDATRRVDGATAICTGLDAGAPCETCIATKCCKEYTECEKNAECAADVVCALTGVCTIDKAAPGLEALGDCAMKCSACATESSCTTMAADGAVTDGCVDAGRSGVPEASVSDATADSGVRDAGADSGAHDAGADSTATSCLGVDMAGCTKSAQCCQVGTTEPVGAGCLVLSETASICTQRCNNFGDCPTNECCIEDESSIPKAGSPPTEPGGLCATVPVVQSLDKPCVFTDGNGYVCTTADGGYSCAGAKTLTCNSAGTPEQFCITFGTESMASARSICDSAGGALGMTACSMTNVLGTCRQSLELFWYYAVPGQTAQVAEMECSSGIWTPWPDGGF